MTRSAIDSATLQRLTGVAGWAARKYTSDPLIIREAARHATTTYTMRRDRPAHAEAWVKQEAERYARTAAARRNDAEDALGQVREWVTTMVSSAKTKGVELLDEADFRERWEQVDDATRKLVHDLAQSRTAKELAEAYETTEAAVKKQVTAARKALTKLFG